VFLASHLEPAACRKTQFSRNPAPPATAILSHTGLHQPLIGPAEFT